MQRRTIAKIVALVAIFGFFIANVGVSNIAYALIPHNPVVDVALGQLARAESAQTPDEIIHFVTVAKAILPERGSVFWWSPEKAKFESVQAELTNIISHTEKISSLESGSERFNTELYAVHAKIEAIQETLIAF